MSLLRPRAIQTVSTLFPLAEGGMVVPCLKAHPPSHVPSIASLSQASSQVTVWQPEPACLGIPLYFLCHSVLSFNVREGSLKSLFRILEKVSQGQELTLFSRLYVLTACCTMRCGARPESETQICCALARGIKS